MIDRSPAARIKRLVGDGTDGSGGMPLPLLFDTVLYAIQKHGKMSLPELRARVIDAIPNKDKRIRVLYETADDPWTEFVLDGLEQLASKDIVAQTDGAWSLSGGFVPGGPMEVIGAKKGRNSSSFTCLIHGDEYYEHVRAAEHRRAELLSLYSRLSADGPGLRGRLDESHIGNLETSIREFGFLKEFPVLEDSTGHILDGRHRLEAARRAGIAPVRQILKEIDDPADAVAIAWLANEGKPWSTKDKERIAKLMTAASSSTEDVAAVISTKARRAVIEAHLKSSPPGTSDREIARIVGCSHTTVAATRRDVSGQAGHLEAKPLNTNGPLVEQTPAPIYSYAGKARPKIETHLKKSPELSNRAIARDANCDEESVGLVRRELEQASEIPITTSRVCRDGKARIVPVPANKKTPSVLIDVDALRNGIRKAIRAAIDCGMTPSEIREIVNSLL